MSSREVSVDEVLAQMTERGLMEWELAVQKAINVRLSDELDRLHTAQDEQEDSNGKEEGSGDTG